MKEVEGKYYYPNLKGVAKADAIVVLSGMMRINEFENNHILEWGDIDRFFKAIELYFSKKCFFSRIQKVKGISHFP